MNLRLGGLRTLSHAVVVAHKNERYFRKIATTVLRWYTELEDGIIQADSGPTFDSRILDYRLDVDFVLRRFAPKEQQLILLIHRDGLTQAQAAQVAGFATDRPDEVVRDLEVRMGRAFDRHRLGDFLRYVEYLR